MASRQLLLPAIHLDSSPVDPSPSRKRHCDDPDCFIWTRTSQAERWAAFDAFHPREIEQDYCDYNPSIASSPFSNAFSSSDSEDDFLHSLKERRIRRAVELKTRAKARLMPPFDHSARQTRRNALRGPSCERSPATTTTRDRRAAYRTPSPPPATSARRNQVHSRSPATPRTPQTPMTPNAHTPASTVAHRSPIPTPHLPMCLNYPSP